MEQANFLSAIVQSAAANNRAAVAAYFNGLPPWPNVSTGPGQLTSGSPETPKEEVHDGSTMSCTTTPYTLTKNPDQIVMFAPDASTLWPGALIQGGSMLSIGSLKELPIKKRAALPLSVDLLITPNTVTVAHPTSATVENAIAALIAPIEGGKDFGSSVSFKQTETYTSEQAMLSLGISASHSGFDVTAKHSAVTAYDKRVITASFIQKAFTVSIDNPSTPADLFTSDFSIGDLHEQEQLGRIRAANPANIPIILNSATYGRIVYVTISSRKTFDELKDALSASVNAGGTSGSTELNAESKKFLKSRKLR